MGEITNHVRSPLLPERYPTRDFFVCDIFDATPKGDMASMEHPVFSLSTKPDQRIRRYENGRTFIEITPSVKGVATVHDRDVLIFCISQIMAALNAGRKVERAVRFKAYDLFRTTNRVTDGQGYRLLKDALERLRGTTITTNVESGDVEITRGFGLIESFEIVRETRDGRMQEVEITLSDWVFNAIRANEVLTIHRDYFRLRKPLERRIYEIARKHCGQKATWRISLPLLQKKCGSSSTAREFKRLVLNIIKDDTKNSHMPDYALSFDEATENVVFTNRGTMNAKEEEDGGFPFLDPETYHAARAVAPGYDVHFLEREWLEFWSEQGRPPLKNPDAAFIGFCRKRHERNPNP